MQSLQEIALYMNIFAAHGHFTLFVTFMTLSGLFLLIHLTFIFINFHTVRQFENHIGFKHNCL